MRTFFIVIAAALAGCNGAPSTAGGEASSGAEAPAAESGLLAVGGCEEMPVDDEVKRVDPGALPGSYYVIDDSPVRCEAQRVIVNFGPGSAAVIASVALPLGINLELWMEGVRTGIIDQLVRDITAGAESVEQGAHRSLTLGEDAAEATCITSTFVVEGEPLVTHACAASKPHGNAMHLIAIAITDTPEEFDELGATLDEAFHNLVDALVIDEE